MGLFGRRGLLLVVGRSGSGFGAGAVMCPDHIGFHFVSELKQTALGQLLKAGCLYTIRSR